MSTYYIAGFPVSDELYHHGILGQKWGIRRYQNSDGSLTPAGVKRYGIQGPSVENGGARRSFSQKAILASVKARRALDTANQVINTVTGRRGNTIQDSVQRRLGNFTNRHSERKDDSRRSSGFLNNEKIKKAVKIGAVVAGTALATYGVYKLNKSINDAAELNIMSKGKDKIDSILTSYHNLPGRPGARNSGFGEIAVSKNRASEDWYKKAIAKAHDDIQKELDESRGSFRNKLRNANEWRKQSKGYKTQYRALAYNQRLLDDLNRA